MKGMMKALVGLFVLSSVGYVVWSKFFAPDSRACNRVADLCGDTMKDKRACLDNIESLRKAAGEEAVAKLESCVLESKSCMEATGCAVGSSVGGVLDQFVRGLQKGVEK